MLAAMSYRRTTEDERKGWLTRFERSGSTAAAFCREHELNYQSLLRWRQMAIAESEGATEFIELEVPCSASASPAEAVELTFPSGLTLRINPHPAPRS
jgi:transposase-like protein